VTGETAHKLEDLESQVLKICQEIVHPTINADTDLIAEGLLDSFHTLKLVTRLEDTFDVIIELSTLGTEDVHTVRAMAKFLLGKLSEG
jgi:acyl carrier protein